MGEKGPVQTGKKASINREGGDTQAGDCIFRAGAKEVYWTGRYSGRNGRSQSTACHDGEGSHGPPEEVKGYGSGFSATSKNNGQLMHEKATNE